MKIILVFLIASLFAENVPFLTCMENPVFETTSIDITPSIPKPGQAVVITINGISLEHCDGGKLNSQVKLKNVPVFEYHYNLCDVSLQKCPIEKGEWTGVIHQLTPRFAFPGIYTTRSTGVNLSGTILSCVEFNFTITKNGF